MKKNGFEKLVELIIDALKAMDTPLNEISELIKMLGTAINFRKMKN